MKNLSFINGQSNGPPHLALILVHAMYRNSDYFARPAGKSLVDHFAAEGTAVIRFDLDGYEKKATPSKEINFSTYVRNVEDVIDLVRKRYPESKVVLIGRSIGGLAAMIAGSRKGVNAIISVAPALWTFASNGSMSTNISQFLKFAAGYCLTRTLGFFPASLFQMGELRAPVGYFREYAHWMVSRNFESSDRTINFLEDLKKNTVPTLILSAPNDKMAPKPNVEWLANHSGRTVERLHVSLESSFEYDANHFSLIYGKNAASKVWPYLSKWLAQTTSGEKARQ